MHEAATDTPQIHHGLILEGIGLAGVDIAAFRYDLSTEVYICFWVGQCSTAEGGRLFERDSIELQRRLGLLVRALQGFPARVQHEGEITELDLSDVEESGNMLFNMAVAAIPIESGDEDGEMQLVVEFPVHAGVFEIRMTGSYWSWSMWDFFGDGNLRTDGSLTEEERDIVESGEVESADSGVDYDLKAELCWVRQ